MVNQLSRRAIEIMRSLEPQLLFVFKGNYVAPEILEEATRRRIVSVNYYPDVSFFTHGPQLPKALPLYDHVFNAKTFGVADMSAHGVKSVSFLAPGFDPELHRPIDLRDSDKASFGCDVSFIGTWSPKKEQMLSALRDRLPLMKLRIWGNQWEKRVARNLDESVMGLGITGDDYTRAICASSIGLCILSESRTGASSGDRITARTFQIPACGTFMMHERSEEIGNYFDESVEAEFFDSADELAEKVTSYLNNHENRSRVARAGLERSLESDYSIDRRMREAISAIESRIP
jgi:spore maturation protein CgeB